MFLIPESEENYHQRLLRGKNIAFWTFVSLAVVANMFDFILMGSSGEKFARFINIPSIIFYLFVIFLFLMKKIRVENAFLLISFGLIANSLLSQIVNENPNYFTYLVLRETLFVGLLIPVIAFMGNWIATFIITVLYCGTITFLSFYYSNEYLLRNLPLMIAVIFFYAFIVSFLTERLERILEDLSNSREKVKDQMSEIENLSRTKDKLFSLIAHDIRGPLGDIMGSAELLDDVNNQLEEKEKKLYAEMLHHSSESLYSMVENLLNWSRLQFAKKSEKVHRFSCSEEIKKTVDLYSSICEEKEITVNVSVPEGECELKAEPEMLIAVLRNLFSNAVKFTPRGGTVNIKVHKDSEKISVQISDTGIGIPSEIMKILFDVTEEKRRKGTDGEGGSGLGLMLCREFVEKNGGKILAESEPNVGTSICFSLPLLPESR